MPTAASFRARFSYPSIIIRHLDLHNVLLDACGCDPLITLEPDAMMLRFTDHGDRVTVTTTDGRSFEGTALIGAHGIRDLSDTTGVLALASSISVLSATCRYFRVDLKYRKSGGG